VTANALGIGGDHPAQAKSQQPMSTKQEPAKQQPKPQPKSQPAEKEKVYEQSGLDYLFGTEYSKGETVRVKGIEYTVLDAKFTSKVGPWNDMYYLSVIMRVKNATSKPIDLSGNLVLLLDDNGTLDAGELESDSEKGILFSTIKPGQSGTQLLQFIVFKKKQYHVEITKPEEVKFNIVPSNPDWKPQKELKGRTWTDNYVGLVGYVAADDGDVNDYDRKFPSPPWYVNTMKQVGDHQFEKTNEKVLHKTKVKVISQNVTVEPYNVKEGALLVETLEGSKKRFWIDVHNFVDDDYWNYPISQALYDGPVIATYNGKGSKPSLDGKWVDLKVGTQVEAVEADSHTKKIKAKVFKQWELGWGGVEVDFDPVSLDIKY
jgi:hypothetical protein